MTFDVTLVNVNLMFAVIDSSVDLLHHLKEEFAGLEAIKDWGELKDQQITSALINRLELKAHEGNFKGRCPHCP